MEFFITLLVILFVMLLCLAGLAAAGVAASFLWQTVRFLTRPSVWLVIGKWVVLLYVIPAILIPTSSGLSKVYAGCLLLYIGYCVCCKIANGFGKIRAKDDKLTAEKIEKIKAAAVKEALASERFQRNPARARRKAV